jgi:hypothetical protein
MNLFSSKTIDWAAGPTIQRELMLNVVIVAVRQPTTTARHHYSLRLGHAVRKRRVATLLSRQSPRAQHEPQAQLQGQRDGRVFLQ